MMKMKKDIPVGRVRFGSPYCIEGLLIDQTIQFRAWYYYDERCLPSEHRIIESSFPGSVSGSINIPQWAHERLFGVPIL